MISKVENLRGTTRATGELSFTAKCIVCAVANRIKFKFKKNSPDKSLVQNLVVEHVVVKFRVKHNLLSVCLGNLH